MIPARFRGRAAGLLGLGILLMLCARGVVHAERALQTRREATELRIARQHDALRALSAIEADRTRIDSLVKAFHEVVLPAGDWESGVAELATVVQVALTRFGAVIESISPAPRDTTVTSAVKPVTVRLVFRSDLRGVVDLLSDMKRSSTILVPRWIQISSTDSFAESSVPEVLKVELAATGWYVER